MNDAPYSANWKLYAPDGAQVQFTLRAEDPDQHIALLETYRATLATRGYTVSEPGLDEGQKIEEVNAYVLGESSKGDACVYLYSSKAALQWRIATVYVEHFAELPFKPAGKKWEASAAPERGEAEKKGFLNSVPVFKIVLEGVPDAESGKTRWRFLKVVAAIQPTPAAPASTKGNGNSHAKPPTDGDFDALTPASIERLKARVLKDAAKAPDSPAPDLVNRTKSALAIALPKSEDRHFLTATVLGTDDPAQWTQGQCDALRAWLNVGKVGDDWVPSAQFLADWKLLAALRPQQQ